jgi:chemotaxis response regulator CheB
MRLGALIWEEKAMSDELSVRSPSQQVSVLVVDDADVIRRTLSDFLKGEPAIKVLGEASNFAEAISMTAALKPDVILLDLHMPDDLSFKPEFVKANLSGARVLAMSLAGDYASEADIRLLAENFGAVKTLDKAKLCDELIPSILQTGTGS